MTSPASRRIAAVQDLLKPVWRFFTESTHARRAPGPAMSASEDTTTRAAPIQARITAWASTRSSVQEGI